MSKESKVDVWFNRSVNVAVLGVIVFAVLRPGGPVSSFLNDRSDERAQVAALSNHWSELSGGADQPVVVEFMDYECPYCRLAHDSLVLLAAEGVAVRYRHLPLDQIHPRATEAALVAICAEEFGLFPEVHELLMSDAEWRQADRIHHYVAPRVGLDPSDLLECVDGDATSARLEEDRRIASDLGIRSTPTFVGRGGVQIGLRDVNGLVQLATTEPR